MNARRGILEPSATGLDYFSASCLGIAPLGPKDAGGPGQGGSRGLFPLLHNLRKAPCSRANQ